MQVHRTQKAGSGVQATFWSGGGKTKAGTAGALRRSLKIQGALGDNLSENSRRKNHGAVRHAVQIGAPDTARERLCDFLCDAFIQNAEGKGLGHGQWLDVRCWPAAPEKARERLGDVLL